MSSGNSFVSLVERVSDLRLVPVKDKVPLVKGWNEAQFWDDKKDIKKQIVKWQKQFPDCGFAFALGPKCGNFGDLVIEPDNEAGEIWCEENLPKTPIATVTRHGFLHRHYKIGSPLKSTGVYQGPVVDLLGSKKAWQKEALSKGFLVVVEKGKEVNKSHLQAVAKARVEALKVIPMGPVIDIRGAGSQAMAPGSVHETGYVYVEQESWTQEAWDARPEFSELWIPEPVRRAREMAKRLIANGQVNESDIDPFWTLEKRKNAGWNYMRHVPAKVSGQGSHATFMNLATVLVRGFALPSEDAKEILSYWAKQVCSAEPWSDKEIVHKINQANISGSMAFNSKLGDRNSIPGIKTDHSERRINDYMARHRLGQEVIPDWMAFEDEEAGKESDHKSSGVDDVKAIEPSEILESVESGIEDKKNDDSGSGEVVIICKTDEIVNIDNEEDCQTENGRNPIDQQKRILAKFGVDFQDYLKSGKMIAWKKDPEGNIVSLQSVTNNVFAVLSLSKEFKGKFATNKMTSERTFCGRAIGIEEEAEIKSLMDNMFSTGNEIPKERILGAITLACAENSFDPVVEFIKKLPKWDGVKRWCQMPKKIFNMTEDQDLDHAATICHRFGMSAMARALNPGEKVDTILVLSSLKQGIGKSTFGEVLFGRDFFSAYAIDDINNKDSKAIVTKNWCLEIGEGEIISNQKHTMAFKAFLSQKEDEFRPPYEKKSVVFPRRCVFIATTNEDHFLSDKTGNRRFWTLKLNGALNNDLLEEWRLQLWAEAYHNVSAYFKVREAKALKKTENKDIVTWGQWWLTDEEQEINDVLNKESETEDIWEGDISTWIMDNKRNTPFRLCDVMKDALMIQSFNARGQDAKRVSGILKSLKCEKVNDGRPTTVDNKSGRFYKAPADFGKEDSTWNKNGKHNLKKGPIKLDGQEPDHDDEFGFNPKKVKSEVKSEVKAEVKTKAKVKTSVVKEAVDPFTKKPIKTETVKMSKDVMDEVAGYLKDLPEVVDNDDDEDDLFK